MLRGRRLVRAPAVLFVHITVVRIIDEFIRTAICAVQLHLAVNMRVHNTLQLVLFRLDALVGVYTFRSSDRPVGQTVCPTGRSDDRIV